MEQVLTDEDEDQNDQGYLSSMIRTITVSNVSRVILYCMWTK
jgi:hypothetical protein